MVTHRIALAADVNSARVGRGFARQHLAALDSDTTDVVVLLISELVTNAVIHGGPHLPDATVDLSIEVGTDGVRVEVTDAGSGTLTVGNGAPDQPSGRGLVLVEHFARQWGCEQHATGKTVWIDITQPTLLGNAPTKGR